MRFLPIQVSALVKTIQKSKRREFLRFIEYRSGHSVLSAIDVRRRANSARSALARIETIDAPPDTPYVFFGLHLQPESSIDVWAPFYSNQLWVIEQISRSLPPTHRLMVKIHKSDVSNYSSQQLDNMRKLPGVDLVTPSAEARSFIERADLVVAIQGTIGLEAALIGKPTIMLGDSPVTVFPTASRIGAIHDFPALIREKLVSKSPDRQDIVSAYASFLAPFFVACHNDWTRPIDADGISNYVAIFDELRRHLTSVAENA